MEFYMELWKCSLKMKCSIISSILTKRAITSHLNSPNTKKTTTYDVGNPGPSFGQTQQCGGVKHVNGNQQLFEIQIYTVYWVVE